MLHCYLIYGTGHLSTVMLAPIRPETRDPSRTTLWQARIVCLSAFGPYVTGSARTEQIVVFGMFALILIFGWPRIAAARSVPPLPFLTVWLCLYTFMLIATVYRPFDPGFYGAQPVSHALSSLALPIALIVVTWYWTLHAEAVALIRAVAPLIASAMCVNALIEVAQVSAGEAAVINVLPRFWSVPGPADLCRFVRCTERPIHRHL